MKFATTEAAAGLRSSISWAVGACVAVAAAPWFSGGQEPVAMLVSGGAVLVAVLLLWRQPALRTFTAGPMAWLYLLLVGWGGLSLLWSVNRYSSIIWLVQLIMAGIIFRLSYAVAGEPGGRERLIRLYLVSAVLFSAYGLYLYFTSEYNRLTGSFYWANPAAAYLIPAVLIGLGRLKSSTGRSWLWPVLTGLFLSTFSLTDSRATSLVLLIMAVTFLLIQKQNKASWIKLVFTLGISILLSLGFVQLRQMWHPGDTIAPGSRFAEAALGESQSGSDRLNYLHSALGIWYAHPLLGTGAGTFGDVHPQYQDNVVSAATNAHNYYLQTLSELGLLGAVLLAGAVALLLFGCLRGVWHEAEAVPLLLGLIGLLLHFGLDIDASYPALLLLAAMLAGLIYRQTQRAPRPLGWRLPAATTLLLIPVISLYQSDAWAQRARILQDQGDYATAAADFGRAHSGLVYNPDLVNAEGIDWYSLAASGAGDVRVDSALALDRAHAAERQDPGDAQHHQLEGRVLELRGDDNGAASAFRTALRLDPHNHPDYALDLANLQAGRAQFMTALQTISSMLGQYPQPVVNNRIADVTLKPTLANLYALQGNIYLSQNNLSAAATSASAGLKLDAKNLRCRALRVQIQKIHPAVNLGGSGPQSQSL